VELLSAQESVQRPVESVRLQSVPELARQVLTSIRVIADTADIKELFLI
jgi:hypothetical protein